MNKILTTTIFIGIFLIFGNIQKKVLASEGVTSQIKPVTEQCLNDITSRYDIPVSVIIGILVSQQSQVGERFVRVDQTVDYGPALINSRWLTKVKRFGIRGKNLQNDGCTNILTLSWILDQYKTEYQGDIWKAVGRFHSDEQLKADTFAELVRKVSARFEEGNTSENTQIILAWVNGQ